MKEEGKYEVECVCVSVTLSSESVCIEDDRRERDGDG